MKLPNERINVKDWLFLGVCWLFLLAGCLVKNRAAPIWLDEIATLKLVADPSLSHCLSALADQVDAVPPLYYIVAHCWAAIFSSSVLSLRLFSALGICAGLGLVFATLRRRFSFWAAAPAVAFAFGSNDTIRFEIVNIRFYGLLLALIALAIFIAFRLSEQDRPSTSLLVANGFTQAALVLCHPFGGLYSAVVLFALAVSDWWLGRRLRWRIILSYFLGWATLLLWIRQLIFQSDINNPHGWIPLVRPMTLLATLNVGIEYYPLFLIFPIAWVLQSLWIRTRRVAAEPRESSTASFEMVDSFLLVFATGALGLIPVVWIGSLLNPNHSLFLTRYFLGTTAAWAFILSQLICYGIAPMGPLRWPTKFVAILFIGLGLHPLLRGSKEFATFEEVRGEVDEAFGHKDLPVVFPASFDYLPREFYSPNASRYYFLLDWPASIAPTADRLASSEYKLLDALRRNYGYDHIVQADQFLRQHDSFLVHDPGRQWVKLRLTPDAYSIEELGTVQFRWGEWKMLLVKRKTAQPP